MNDLKPCPFCGGVAKYEINYDDYNHDCIVCQSTDCGAKLTVFPYEGDKLIENWNRRTEKPPCP